MSDTGSILLIAGESSGDLHGGHLAEQIHAIAPGAKLFGLGGSRMKEAGVEILADPTRIAVVGLVEILAHLAEFRRLFHLAVRALEERKPDLVVLIDYPGFNMRFAREVKRLGIRLVYYISPQIWAWDPGRVHALKRLVDRMIVIFPFEKELYERHGVPVSFVGHPFLDRVRASLPRLQALERFGLEDGLPVVGLLPGSRQGEVRRILPLLLAAGERMKETLPSSARFLLIKSPTLPWELYSGILRGSTLQPKVIERWDYDGIYACDVTLVASGSATLECALLERPMVIVYKTSWPTYLISRLLIRIPAIGLVNVVHGSKLVPELIQHRATPSAIAREATELWASAQRRREMGVGFQKIRHSLGSPGAARRAAQTVLSELDFVRQAKTTSIA